MKKLIFFIIFLPIFFINTSSLKAQTCIADTVGGSQVAGCKICGSGTTTYCCQTNQNEECTCGGASCSCQVGGKACNGSGGAVTGSQTCTCAGSGGTFPTCTNAQCGNDKNVYNGSFDYCSCTPVLTSGTCNVVQAPKNTLYCQIVGGPTSAPPNPTSAPNPTATSVPPSPTPTPQIVGTIYTDPNDGTVSVSGGMCTKIGTAPVALALANASVRAVKTSSGVTTNGSIVGSTYRISGGLVSGASDYQVILTLPTPAPNSTTGYVCGCPVTGGNDYVCQYSGIAANGTPNFFVRESSLANAWWQTYGGSVYARDQIQSQIPVGTCDASGTCTSALIVANGTDTSGFAVLGTGGVLKTTSDGSDAYVHAAGSRTTASGAYAVGVSPGRETYDYFTNRLNLSPTSVNSLAELKAAILGQASSTTGIYMYTGGILVIDKDSGATPLEITDNKRVVVFTPGDLEFTNSSGAASPVLTNVPVGSFLMFVTQGNITIDQSVGYTSATTNPLSATANISGVFVADGRIIVESDGDTDVADRKFIGAGTFVGWDQAGAGNGIELQRSFQDTSGSGTNSINPAEAFVYRPDFVTNYPSDLKVAHYNWQEIAPQR